MRRTIWLAIAAPLMACSLVFGLHDNEPPSPGCPAEAGSHTFCELFDELPSWPSDATMTPAPDAALLLLGADAGCNTQPHCLSAAGPSNFAQRIIATPTGVHTVKYDFHARFDLIDSGVVPRVAWIDLDTGGSVPVTFGVTFAHDVDTNDFEVFVFGTPSPSNVNSYDYVVPVTVGAWFHLTLAVDVAARQVSLASETPLASRTYDYVAQWQLPTFAPSDVKKVTIGGGVGTGMTHTATTLDTIVVDVIP